MNNLVKAVLAVGCCVSMSAQAIVVTTNTNASSLVAQLVGSGITIVGTPTLNTDTTNGVGTFTNGGNIGIDTGVLLTTGDLSCAVGPNNLSNCGQSNGVSASLKFDFTSDTGLLFFNYVFASEEYKEFVDKGYNDSFQLLLNGVNIALLPSTTTSSSIVSIDNVNQLVNTAFFVDNTNGTINTQYDGLTTVLTASASVVAGDVNTFEFVVTDNGDSNWDSGALIQAGTFSGQQTSVPEPGSLALAALGLIGLTTLRRRKSA